MIDITARQLEFLVFIDSFIKLNHYAPSIREIATGFNITPAGARDVIKAIERKGYVKSVPEMARTLHLTQKGIDKIKELNK